MNKLTTEEFINRANLVHNNKYNYEKTIYTHSKSKLLIVCNLHGDFLITPSKHINDKVGCKKCNIVRMKNTFTKSNNDFINETKKIHGDKYDYSLVKYINNKTKVKIICPKHGIFEQRADSHGIGGYGCDMCKETIGERMIRVILTDSNLNFISQYKFNDCKNEKPLRFDFYLPELNILIEYNGKQHYEPNHFFSSKSTFEEQQKRDEIKKSYCKNNNIPLLIIKYDEDIRSKLKEFISHFNY